MVGGSARLVKALGTALRVRCQPRGALKQPRLSMCTSTTTGSLCDPRELRSDLLVMPNSGERSMPRSAIRIHGRQRIGERRMRVPPLPRRGIRMHR